MLAARGWSTRIITFAVVAILSFSLLMMFPFYPPYLMAILALLLGVLALEFPYVGISLAILLSVFAAMYQNAYAGLTYLVILVLLVGLAQSSAELGLVASSWVLTFLPYPSLGIVPTILAGLHYDRKTAVKIGVLSSVTVFLLAWSRGLSQAGLILLSHPALGYGTKGIPTPWEFSAFLPGAEFLEATAVTSYFGQLASNIGDFRLYVFIVAWSVTAYFVSILASRTKKLAYVPAALLGAIPSLAAALIFAAPSLIDLGIGLVGIAISALAYRSVQRLIFVPALGVFTRLEDLVPGGIPQKYSLLLGAPVCDERNMVIEQFLQPAFESKSPCFLLTSDMDFARNYSAKFGDRLTVLVANPRADTISGKNVVPIATGTQNLTTLNIELVKVVRNVASTGGKICLDVLSDILLTHKLLTTRKWISDLVPRLDEWGFTVLSVFNPILHSSDDGKGLTDLFKGFMEIFDKEIAGKMRKVIVVRKMSDLLFNEAELTFDRRLTRGAGPRGLRARLSR